MQNKILVLIVSLIKRFTKSKENIKSKGFCAPYFVSCVCELVKSYVVRRQAKEDATKILVEDQVNIVHVEWDEFSQNLGERLKC